MKDHILRLELTMKSLIARFFIIVFFAFSIAACTGTNPYGTAYGSSEAQGIQKVYYGTIVNLTAATINNNDGNNFLGGLAGAAVGGILGSDIGGGTGQDIATIGGAVLGSYLGNKGANELGKTNGVNITIRLDRTNQTIAIVQPVDPKIIFKVGDQVQINVSGRSARVTPI